MRKWIHLTINGLLSFTIIKINKEKQIITLKYKDNDYTLWLDVEINNFQKLCFPAYGLTCHCSQGVTIDR